MHRLICVIWFCAVLTCGTLHAGTWHQVRWVDDGDTVVLQDGTRVRYIGINAPEIAHKGRKAQPFGNRAKEYNIELVLGKSVLLEFDREHKDQYGRVLSYLFLRDSTFVNQQMVKRAYAHVLFQFPNIRYHDLLLKAQRQAMTDGIGIWQNWQESESAYPANRKTRRFHRMACPYGKNISARNRIVFKTSWEAFQQGFSPGKKCFYP